jgi:hypothetical protein
MAKVQYLKGHKCPAPEGFCPHAVEDAHAGGRLVLPKQVVEVPDADVWGYVQSDLWDAADKATQALADTQAEAVETALAIERGQLAPAVPADVEV